MATYRLSMSVAKRSDGRNAVAMAAYRSGQELYSERTGETIDFTRKGGILHSELVLPAGAPEWAADREIFWNRSEAADRRGDSVIAREIQLSLPHELPAEQRRALTLEFAGAITARYGIAVDTSLHAPNRHGDERNHHAHLLLCTRPFDLASKTGFGNKLREFDAVAHQRAKTENHVETLRQDWCDRLNTALERAGVRSAEGATVQLDHRSYERRGIELEPSVKLGPAASAMERRGEASDRGNDNRSVATRNAERAQLHTEIAGLEQQLTKSPQEQPGGQADYSNDDQAPLGGSNSPMNAVQPLQYEQARLEELEAVAAKHMAALRESEALREMEQRKLEFSFDPAGDLQEQLHAHEQHIDHLDMADRRRIEVLRAEELAALNHDIQQKHEESKEQDRLERAAENALDPQILGNLAQLEARDTWYAGIDQLRYQKRGHLTEEFQEEQAQIHQQRLNDQADRDASYRDQLQQAYTRASRPEGPEPDEPGPSGGRSAAPATSQDPIPRQAQHHTAESLRSLLQPKTSELTPDPNDHAQRDPHAPEATDDVTRRQAASSGIEELHRKLGITRPAANDSDPKQIQRDDEEQRRKGPSR